jgi:mannonate dehydratase
VKILAARVILCSPDRNFVTLRIDTDEGVYGLGDATLNGRELAVAAYLTEHVIPCLVGSNAASIEDTWQFLYRGAYWRRGPVTMTAIAAVDMALWDIKGKALNTPVYNLLGGASRQGCLVYTHANGADIAETVDSVQRHMAEGYLAVRAQSGVPGVASSYGVPRQGKPYEPAERGLPGESLWSTERYLNFAPKLFAAVRAAVGEDLHLLHDVHHRLTPIEAARLGKELEPHHLFWLEDPTPAELQDSFALIRQHTTTPLATGEVFNSIWDCKELIERKLIDYIRMTVVHGGGITHARRVADFAAVHGVRTGYHGATDLSPIAMAASLHLGLALHNFGIQEHMPHTATTDEVFPHGYTFEKGYMHPGDRPGLGVELDEDLASRYPYQRAYLPVARKLDGTLTDW